MAIQKVEFEFPHEKDDNKIEIESSSAEELKSGKKQQESDEIEIEVVDDTPEKDRGRKPSEPPAELTDDELEEYSERVRNRIKHFSKGYHDERRAKEQALRERQELEAMAQQLLSENQKLKNNANKSQSVLIEQAKKTAKFELDQAKARYKQAYEAGDSDKVLEAQEALMTAKSRVDRLAAFKTPALQNDESKVESNTVSTPQQESAPALEVDPKAQSWSQANTWFGEDDEMTSFALGLHNKLVKTGMDPQSDEYYEKIDSRMREVFPDYFGEETPEPATPKRQASVVAPATRSTAPKKIRLTQTQLRIANRLGLTAEQYAKQVALEMRKQNG